MIYQRRKNQKIKALDTTLIKCYNKQKMDKKKKETCQCEDCTCDGSCDCTDDNPCSCECESEELIDNSQEMWRDA